MKLSEELQPVLLKLATVQRSLDFGAGEKEVPEQVELDKAEAAHKRLLDASAAAQMAVDDMENEILRIQADERKLRKREREDKKQLGAETDPARRKDLEYDRYAAKSRIADLMSELAEAHNQIHALRQNRDVYGAKIDDSTRKIEALRRAADAANEAAANVADPAEEIEALRAQLPADVLSEYDTQREENEVGAAAFKSGKSCGGCFIVLPPADRSAIAKAPADELPQCTDCGSYLIRGV